MNYGAAVTTIVALVLSMAAVTPAFAGGHSEADIDVDNDVKIYVQNEGLVVNSTTAEASTGGNYAGGSTGGDAGQGGHGGNGDYADADATANADGDADADADANANGGDGGNGGDAGNGGAGGVGGTVSTGDAEANAGTLNVVNSNDIKVEGCGCDSVDLDDLEEFDDVDVTKDNEVKIELLNRGAVINYTDAYATTGWNDAGGSTGGAGDDGGGAGDGDYADADADADADSKGCGCGDADADAEADANGGNGGQGGHGGNGGEGGPGGLVVTGEARSNAGTINLVNSNLIRVIR